MCKHMIAIVLCTAAQLLAAPPATAPKPFTDQEQKSFDGMYGVRIAKAATRLKQAALARELYGGLGGAKGGLKYLLLLNTKDLATKGGDLPLAIEALGKLIAMKRCDPQAALTELLDLQIRRFAELQRLVKISADPAIVKKRHALGSEAIDVAIELANIHRAGGRFREAERPESRILTIATLISSPKRTRLRQGVAISRELDRLARQAELYKKQGKLNHAVWAWLDAGMYAKADALKPSKPDATAVLVLRATLDKTAAPADILAAAQAWDKRAATQSGPLEQLRLTRAAELYRRYLLVGEGLGLQVARLRLTTIAAKLGDLRFAQVAIPRQQQSPLVAQTVGDSGYPFITDGSFAQKAKQATSPDTPETLRFNAVWGLAISGYTKDSAQALMNVACDNDAGAVMRGYAAMGLSNFTSALPPKLKREIQEQLQAVIVKEKGDAPDGVIRTLISWGSAPFVYETLGVKAKEHPMEIEILAGLPGKPSGDRLWQLYESCSKRRSSYFKRSVIGRALIQKRDTRGIEILMSLLPSDKAPSGQHRHNVFTFLALHFEQSFGYDSLNYDSSLNEAVAKMVSWWDENSNSFVFADKIARQ